MNPITSFHGNVVQLKTSDPLHFSDTPKVKREGDDLSGSFADVLNKAVSKANDLEVNSQELTQKMIYSPGSVDIHTVMIAQQKAEIALTFTKAIRDEALSAYRELISLR